MKPRQSRRHGLRCSVVQSGNRGAIRWAEANRGLIAQRLFEALNAAGERHLDIWHNLVQPHDS
ncbi:hypothetical protein CKO27_23530 [Thiocystis violacea]|nr:hypothetical protein [Thiocystis violacea]